MGKKELTIGTVSVVPADSVELASAVLSVSLVVDSTRDSLVVSVGSSVPLVSTVSLLVPVLSLLVQGSVAVVVAVTQTTVIVSVVCVRLVVSETVDEVFDSDDEVSDFDVDVCAGRGGGRSARINRREGG